MTAARGGRLGAFAALIAGLLLVVLAAPRTVAGLMALPGEQVLAALGRGERPPPPRLAEAAAGHRAALGWHDDAEARTDLAALDLAHAGAPALPPPLRRALLDSAIAGFRAGLALGPARPYAWTQYADALLARDGGGARLDAALRMSLMTGGYEPRLVLQRVALGFRADRVLAEDVRAALRAQVRIAAEAAPRPLAEFARARFALGWVRAALADDPALLRRFDAAYFSLPVRG